LSLLLLAGCAGKKTITPDELRSQIGSAISLASETETFLDYVRQHRSTRPYSAGHLNYLADEADRASQDLQKSVPPANAEQQFQTCLTQLRELVKQLTAVRSSLDNRDALAVATTRITHIRKALEQAKSSL
jgi:hypothetical protein